MSFLAILIISTKQPSNLPTLVGLDGEFFDDTFMCQIITDVFQEQPIRICKLKLIQWISKWDALPHLWAKCGILEVARINDRLFTILYFYKHVLAITEKSQECALECDTLGFQF